MNTFKRKALMSAVLGTLGVAGSAEAVNLNANGLGQVLLYPYYTVQTATGGAYNTLLSIVNTTSAVKAVKVRFREGKNSQEVLDFHLFLSPNDMWTGGIVPSSAADGAPGRLFTFDVSCTNPQIGASGVEFRNYAYSGSNSDGLAAGVDRTREGYVEVIEMGVLDPLVGPGTAAVHTAPTNSPSCIGLTGQALAATVGGAVTAPTGGLTGTGALVNVDGGRDTMYRAEALDNWRTVAAFAEVASLAPTLGQATPATSAVISSTSVYLSSWSATGTASAGAKAVSATMMHSEVINEFILDNATRSNTDWVLTFPTRSAFVSSTAAVAPFTNVLTTNGACEAFSFTFFNREEGTLVANDFSPSFGGVGPTTGNLCWESTVLSIRSGATHSPTTGTGTSLVLGSVNTAAVNIQSSGFQNGWASLHFSGVGSSATGLVSDATSQSIINGTRAFAGAAGTVTSVTGGQTFFGLPVIGFMVANRDRLNLLNCAGSTTTPPAQCQGTFSGSVGHAYRNVVSPN